MKYYKDLVTMGCFTLYDVTKLTNNLETARSICKSYLKKGYIKRVKRDLYVAISIETGQPVVNRFVIASHISDNSIVSHHSAFEYYGYANQVFYEVQVTSDSRFRNFSFDGYNYRRIMPQIKTGVVNENGVRVTTLERTVIDYINQFEKVGGLEELLHCIFMIPSLNESLLLSYLSEYNNGFLYQKTGYILSNFVSSLGLSEDFFKKCKKHLPKGKSYLYERTPQLIYDKDWHIYVPEDFSHLINKGVSDFDTI